MSHRAGDPCAFSVQHIEEDGEEKGKIAPTGARGIRINRPAHAIGRSWRDGNRGGTRQTMATLEDIEDLIARTALADRAAFQKLYQLTSAKLFGISLRVLGTTSEAEEAVQDSYIKIWRSAGRYQAGGYSPMTWLITIARNTAIDRLRARRAAGADLSEADAVPSSDPGPEALAIAGSERARLMGCLDELDADRAEAVRGAYLMGLTYQELAESYGIPLNTMRTWLRRSLRKLKECLTR